MDGQANTGYNSALIAALRGSSPAPQQMGGISFFDPSAGAQGGMQASPINFTPSSRQAAFNPEQFAIGRGGSGGSFGGITGAMAGALMASALNRNQNSGGGISGLFKKVIGSKMPQTF